MGNSPGGELGAAVTSEDGVRLTAAGIDFYGQVALVN